MKAADCLKSTRDSKWPRPPRRDAQDRAEWEKACEEVSLLSARAARIRRNALHVWTARIISGASDLTIVMPKSIKEATATPRGDAKQWGANVEIVSTVNRHVLNQAPALARAMLEYKAAEAGIRCDVITDDAPSVAISEKLVAAGKSVRKAKRAIRKQES
jgi:hypothetical protein